VDDRLGGLRRKLVVGSSVVGIETMIRITTHSALAWVTFPYDAEAVELVKTIPGRRWDPGHKHWTIDALDVRMAAVMFLRAGYDVAIDGVPYEEVQRSSAPRVSPLVSFFAGLPVRLRQPAYRALSKVLHPDAGGDTVLMQELNRAIERHR
jgi:hypothetical protein